jgi:Divergent InlB B-repeat domain
MVMETGRCDTAPMRGWRFGGLCLGLLVATSGVPADATTFAPGCSGVQGNASALVSDMALANAVGGSNTINLSAGCIYDLKAVDNNWYGPNGLPPVANRLTIEGHGATIARDPTAAPFRLFYIGADPSSPGTEDYTSPGAGSLTLDEVTLSHGLAQGGDANGGGGGAGMGGAIFNQGALTVTRSMFTANEAHGGSSIGATAGSGGGGMGTNSVGEIGGGFGSGSFGGAPGGKGQHDAGGGGGAGFSVSDTGGNAALSPHQTAGVGGGPPTGTAGIGGGFAGPTVPAGDGGGSGAATFGIDSGAGGSFGAGGGVEGGGGGVGGGGGGGTEAGGGGGFGGGGGMGNTGSGSGKGGAGGFGGGGGGGGSAAGASGFGGGYGNGTNGGGGAGMGGAIFNMQGTVTIVNSTIAGNSAIGGTDQTPDHGKGIAGALFNLSGPVSVTGSTVADNSASTSASEIYNLVYDAHQARAAQVVIRGTILSGGGGPFELASAKTSYIIPMPNLGLATVDVSQHDLVRSMNPEEATTISGSPLTKDPLLGPLQDNGGPTQTMALEPGSPAIDAGMSFGTTIDQRRDPRPVDFPALANGPGGDGSDIGAFELQRTCSLQSSPTEPCHILTIAHAGSGAGTVTGPGLSCSAGCTRSYAASATLTLSAKAARGSVFAGWGGVCAGRRQCTVSMSADRSVSARFNKLPPLRIGRLTQSHERWRAGSGSPHLARKSRTPIGTAFSFTLNRSARVTLAFQSHGKPDGRLHFRAHKGRDIVFFAGRISRTKRLNLGRHRLIISAVDSAGLHARQRSLTFTIVK